MNCRKISIYPTLPFFKICFGILVKNCTAFASCFYHLFSPSCWSRTNQAAERLKKHTDFGDTHSKIVTEAIPCQIIPYGPRIREVIQIYGTNLPEHSPIFIYFHGGFWQFEKVKHNSNNFIAKHLYPNNVKSIFVGYELCPNVTLAEIAQNAARALQLCLNYAKEHKTRALYLSGHSAGAQIVAMLFKTFIPNLPEEDQSLFRSSFLLTGVYDVIPLLPTYLNDLLKLDETAATEASPLHQKFAANNCKLFIVVAKYDSPRLIQQGEEMYKHVSQLGFAAKFVFLEDMDHFDVIEGLYDEQNEITKLIVKYCTMKD